MSWMAERRAEFFPSGVKGKLMLEVLIADSPDGRNSLCTSSKHPLQCCALGKSFLTRLHAFLHSLICNFVLARVSQAQKHFINRTRRDRSQRLCMMRIFMPTKLALVTLRANL